MTAEHTFHLWRPRARRAFFLSAALCCAGFSAQAEREPLTRAPTAPTPRASSGFSRLVWSDSQSSDYQNQRDRGGYAPRGASVPSRFDYYVFSLSWSPTFCETHPEAQNRPQCKSNSRFVVHGLWPQYEKGFPQDCGRHARPVSQTVLESAQGVFPDAQLARYEWRKHGTCSGDDPQTYFRNAKRVRDSIVIPPQLASGAQSQTLAPGEILRAFENANPRLRPDMAAVVCRNGEMEEIRFCLTKDLSNFRSCPEVAGHSCRAPAIRAPAP